MLLMSCLDNCNRTFVLWLMLLIKTREDAKHTQTHSCWPTLLDYKLTIMHTGLIETSTNMYDVVPQIEHALQNSHQCNKYCTSMYGSSCLIQHSLPCKCLIDTFTIMYSSWLWSNNSRSHMSCWSNVSLSSVDHVFGSTDSLSCMSAWSTSWCCHV